MQRAAGVALPPDQALQLLQRRDFRVGVHPAEQGVERRAAGLHRLDLPHDLGDRAVRRVRCQESGKSRAGEREQRAVDEGDRRGGAFDIRQDRRGPSRIRPGVHAAWKRSLMVSPVYCATQPDWSLKTRSAVKNGRSPASNQWRVPAGTLIRSPCSQCAS